MRPHFNSVFHLQINYSEACLFLNFIISGKVTSLPKVIKYVKRSKYSFHDFSAKHTPSATLTGVFVIIYIENTAGTDNRLRHKRGIRDYPCSRYRYSPVLCKKILLSISFYKSTEFIINVWIQYLYHLFLLITILCIS